MEAALESPGKLSSCYSIHSYSFLNVVRLVMQGCFEPAGPYNMWKSLGRHVKKGAKEVIKPVLVTIEDPETGEKVEKLIGFKAIRSAFGLSDAEGKELVIPEPPDWKLETVEKNLGIKRVEFHAIDITIQGYSRGKEYALNPVARFPLKTAVHEIGHILLGHTIAPREGEKKLPPLEIQECQAELAAHLVLNEPGMLDEEMASSSRAYIQDWRKNVELPDSAIRQVLSATERILKAGRLAPAIGRIALQEDQF